MAKSQIIKDLANGTIDTVTAMKRAKVLFSDLGHENLLKWIDYELTGYPVDVPLPDYRKEKGDIVGTYLISTGRQIIQFKETSIPLGKMPKDKMDELLSANLTDGISALKRLLAEKKVKNTQIGKIVPADFLPAICKYNNNPYMHIASAKVIIGAQCIENIFSTIENRLLDALLVLEKEFGNLDNLDLNVAKKTDSELQQINNNVYVIIYNDNSVSIGDSNSIKNSNIASTIE